MGHLLLILLPSCVTLNEAPVELHEQAWRESTCAKGKHLLSKSASCKWDEEKLITVGGTFPFQEWKICARVASAAY